MCPLQAVEAKVGQALQHDAASKEAPAAHPGQPKSRKSAKKTEQPLFKKEQLHDEPHAATAKQPHKRRLPKSMQPT